MTKERKITGASSETGRTLPSQIPVFSLYGETARIDDSEFVHIEDIRARSERYHWRISPHQHRGLFQVVFVARGAAEVHADGQVRKVTAPFALSIPPAVVHSFRFRPRTQGYVLTLAEAMLPQTRYGGLIETLFVEPCIVSFADAPQIAKRIATLLEQIVTELCDNAPARAAMQESLVNAVLLLIERQRRAAAEDGHGKHRQRDFARLRALVEAHFLEHWTVGRYAETMKMTEGRLNRLSQAVAGKSAFDLVQDRLLLEARRRLIYIAAPVSLLAYELGFQDPAYFSRYFKTRVGVTPSAFRREAR